MTATVARIVEDRSTRPDRRFRPIVDVVANLAASETGAHRRLSLVIQHEGTEALSLRLGPPSGTLDEPGDEEPFVAVCGSAFKPVLAVCLARALDRRGIDLDAPLADSGEGLADRATTYRHVLDHQAGLPHVRDLAPELSGLDDHQNVLDRLRRLAPLWPAGTRSAYHAVSYGHVLQIAYEDLTGRSLDAMVWEDVLAPAGVTVENVDLPTSPGAPLRRFSLTVGGRPLLPWRPDGRSVLYRALYPLPDLVEHLERAVDRRRPVLSCGVPASACALAAFYSAAIGATSGSDPFGADLRTRILTGGPVTFDQVMRQRLSWSYGFLRGAGVRRLTERRQLIGLPGYGGSIGLGDAETGVAVGIVATHLDADRVVGRETQQICEALADVLPSL